VEIKSRRVLGRSKLDGSEEKEKVRVISDPADN